MSIQAEMVVEGKKEIRDDRVEGWRPHMRCAQTKSIGNDVESLNIEMNRSIPDVPHSATRPLCDTSPVALQLPRNEI